jgi:hypothetical protein
MRFGPLTLFIVVASLALVLAACEAADTDDEVVEAADDAISEATDDGISDDIAIDDDEFQELLASAGFEICPNAEMDEENIDLELPELDLTTLVAET